MKLGTNGVCDSQKISCHEKFSEYVSGAIPAGVEGGTFTLPYTSPQSMHCIPCGHTDQRYKALLVANIWKSSH